LECYIVVSVLPPIHYKSGMLQVIIVEHRLIDSLYLVVFYYNQVIQGPHKDYALKKHKNSLLVNSASVEKL
jgi:hypothetical protein